VKNNEFFLVIYRHLVTRKKEKIEKNNLFNVNTTQKIVNLVTQNLKKTLVEK
jgi:hypothetical protein